jgi:heavy metal sensor kinase
MNAPIRVRMTAWYVVLLGAVIVAVGAFVIVRLRADLTDAADRSLHPAASQIAAGYAQEGIPDFRDVARTVLAGERAAAQVLAADGTVVARFGDPVSARPMIASGQRRAVLGGRGLTNSAQLGPARQDFRLTARAVTRRGQLQLIVAAVSLGPVNRSVHRVLVLLLLTVPAALAATALGGWWLSRRALRPIDHITRTADAIGARDLDERILVPRANDEVAQLAQTLNTMLDRIQTGVEEQRRLVADTSHELRTPLAVMRSEIDVSLRADALPAPARTVLESTREEVDRMRSIVDDLVTLATADEGRLQLARETTDLHELASNAAQSLRALAERRHVSIDVDGESVFADLDPDRMHQVLRNLLTNAIAFSPDGGRVTISIRSERGEASVLVADEGPGVPLALRERVFDRFFRSDASRTRRTGGSGLGLAIAREVVRAHGGVVGVESNGPRGSCFYVRVPPTDSSLT